jgi:glycosyltransferase involved in cell wall biosynthesis
MVDVSIVIPTYNRATLLPRTIKSVLSQSYTNFEVLVIDDGSDDNTRQVVATFKDKRLFYYYKNNGGVCSARNFGMKKAFGTFISFLDSDDFWPEDYLKIMVENLNNNPSYKAAYSRVEIFDKNGNLKPYGKQNRFKSGFIIQDLFSGGLPILESAILFRKTELRDFYWDEALKSSTGGDGLLRLSNKISFLYVPNIPAYRQTPENSISRNARNNLTLSSPQVLERFYFQLDGKELIPKQFAYKKISHRYRRCAKNHFEDGYRIATLKILKKAIKYYPLDIRLYLDYFIAYLNFLKNDKNPLWEFPKPLSSKISTGQL